MKKDSEERILDILEDILRILDNAEKNNCKMIDKLKYSEKKQADLAHLIEFEPDKSDKRKIELLEQIEKIRKERRNIKDDIDFNHSLKEFSKNNKKIIKSLFDELKNKVKSRENRVYHPRTNILDKDIL